jgi:hypothetical protein
VVAMFVASCDNDDNGNKELMPDSSARKNEKTTDSTIIVNRLSGAVLEAKIIDTLMKISFVKKTNEYLDSLTDHRHGIAFIMDSVASNEISIMAGYNGPERFETYYNFTVYPKSFDIMIEYPDTGELVSIDQYIKLKKE